MTFLGDGTGLLVFASVANAGSSALYQNLGVLSFAMADVNNDSYADIGGVVRGRADATSLAAELLLRVVGERGRHLCARSPKPTCCPVRTPAAWR